MKWSSALVPVLRCLGTSFKDHCHPLSIGCTCCNKGPEDKRGWTNEGFLGVFCLFIFLIQIWQDPATHCKNLTDLCTSLHNHCHPLGIASTSCYQSPVDIGIIPPPRLGCLRSHGKCNPLHWVALITSLGYQRTIRRQSIWNHLHPKHADKYILNNQTNLSPSSASSRCAAWLSSRMPASR